MLTEYAFPLPVTEANPGHPGMTLRDYFAGQALAELGHPDYDPKPEAAAVRAYEIADAMLKARQEPAPSPTVSAAAKIIDGQVNLRADVEELVGALRDARRCVEYAANNESLMPPVRDDARDILTAVDTLLSKHGGQSNG